MGEVLVTYKIMPKDVEINLDEIINEINKKIKVEKVEKKPIAFGLVALMISTVVKDTAKATDEIEKLLTNIEGVGSVEVVEVTRLLR